MSLPNPPKIAICSGSMRSEVMIVLERLCEANIFPMAEVIVTADNVSKGKSSPEGYLLTLEKLGVSAKDAYAIEDSPSGIKAAKSADLKTLALKTSFDDGRLNEADEIYENFIDLLQHKALSVAS